MSDTQTLINRIRRELNRSTAMMSDGVILDSINSALDLHRDERFWFNEKRKTFTMSAGQAFYDLPADFIEDDLVVLIDSTSWREVLTKHPYSFVEDRQENVAWQSRPVYYTIYQNQLYVYPTPDRTYSYILAYLYDLSVGGGNYQLSVGAANAWTDPSAGEQLLRLESKADLLEQYIRGPEARQEAVFVRRDARNARRMMKRKMARKRASHRITPWS